MLSRFNSALISASVSGGLQQLFCTTMPDARVLTQKIIISMMIRVSTESCDEVHGKHAK